MDGSSDTGVFLTLLKKKNRTNFNIAEEGIRLTEFLLDHKFLLIQNDLNSGRKKKMTAELCSFAGL
jgi:hypothetical protein